MPARCAGPNYRGSTNYGNKHLTDIVGNYFAPGYEDIMSGLGRYLIARGSPIPDRMALSAGRAGGHWSNGILTHTDRLQAISFRAGPSNWFRCTRRATFQRNRQFYLGDKLPTTTSMRTEPIAAEVHQEREAPTMSCR